MKLLTSSILAALLLSASPALADDGASSTEVGSAGGACGFQSMVGGNDPPSCVETNPDEIMIGVWLCEDDDMGSCGCADFYGCDNAAYYGEYYININDNCAPWGAGTKSGACGGDNNMICDTLGGWRPTDAGYRTRRDKPSESVYGMQYKGIKFEVHPHDLNKNIDATKVKLWVGNEDYCMGPTPEGTLYDAWDGNRNAPGWWTPQSGHDNYVKSLRPFVDWYDWTGTAPPSGVGVKMNVWPDRHMSSPFDQISNIPNLPDGSWQKAEDQVWCMQTDDGGAWWRSWESSAHNPYVPAGSIQFGLTDAAPCQMTRQDYCNSIDKENTCLAARLYNKGDNPPDQVSSWDDTFVAQTYIKMTHLCDDNDNSFCLNLSDGSGDPEGGICGDNWWTMPDGTPYYNSDGTPQLWWTNYIVQIIDNCNWGG
uniref:Uncharacterized protein n=1 Tax=Chloropicon laureae TaxID=464258 RepID=A0A7S3E4G2_9CHLO